MRQSARSLALALSLAGSAICVGVNSAAAAPLCVAGTPGPGSNLGANPNGAQFCNVVSTDNFINNYFFTLTVASNFNVNITASNSSFPQIDNWEMAVYLDSDGNGTGDSLINPPGVVGGTGNPQTIALSILNLAANTGTGQYLLQVTGDAALAAPDGSIYNGNVSSVAVPGPIIGAGLPGLLAACTGLVMLGRRRRKAMAA